MIYEKLKELGFKITKNIPKGSSILLPDGNFLDLNENRDLILNIKTNRTFLIHDDLEQYLLRNNLVNISDYLTLSPERATKLTGCNKKFLLVLDNAIYLQDGTNWKDKTENCYIELPKQKLTKEQENTLLSWLDNLYYNGNNRVEIIKDTKILTFSFSDYIPDDIIKKIKLFY